MNHKETPLRLNSQTIPLNPFKRQYKPTPLPLRIWDLPDYPQAGEISGEDRRQKQAPMLPDQSKTGEPEK